MNGEKTQIEQIEESSFGKNVDWVLFSFGTLLLSLVVAMIVIFPDFSAASINRLYQNVTSQFGVLYVFIAITLLIFLLSVAISKHGNVVLGNTNKLAYSHFSWAAMLFCAGIGIFAAAAAITGFNVPESPRTYCIGPSGTLL